MAFYTRHVDSKYPGLGIRDLVAITSESRAQHRTRLARTRNPVMKPLETTGDVCVCLCAFAWVWGCVRGARARFACACATARVRVLTCVCTCGLLGPRVCSMLVGLARDIRRVSKASPLDIHTQMHNTNTRTQIRTHTHTHDMQEPDFDADLVIRRVFQAPLSTFRPDARHMRALTNTHSDTCKHTRHAGS